MVIQMVNRYMKSGLILLNIRAMQIKTTVRYHVTLHLLEWLFSKCVDEVHYSWEYKLVEPLLKMLWSFLEKLKIKPLFDPAIPLLVIYMEIGILKRYLHFYVYYSIIYKNQDIQTTYVFSLLTVDYTRKMCILYRDTQSNDFKHKKRRKSCHLLQHGCGWNLRA